MQDKELLKKDLFGEIWYLTDHGQPLILRDAGAARWWLGWLARKLLRREARALLAVDDLEGVPQLLRHDRTTLYRSFLSGVAMYEARPSEPEFFNDLARLLRRLHRAGIAHNDLAKEPNILVCDDGSPAIVDFQLATRSAGRGWLFRAAAREDIRHLLKHKRTYRPDLLTRREQAILDSPSFASRAWQLLVKPVYNFVTRHLFGWSDREGTADRGRQG